MLTIDRILKQFSSEPLGLVEYQGALKTGGYVLTEKGKRNWLNMSKSPVFC